MSSPRGSQAARLVLDLDRHCFFGPPRPGHIVALVFARQRLEAAGFRVPFAVVVSARHSWWHLWRAAAREQGVGDWLFCDTPADHLASEEMRQMTAEACDMIMFSAVSSEAEARGLGQGPVVVFGGPGASMPTEDHDPSRPRVLAVQGEQILEFSEAEAREVEGAARRPADLQSLLGECVASMHQKWPVLPATGYQELTRGGRGGQSAEDFSRSPHDAAAWRRAFADAGDGTSTPNMQAIKRLRVLIWKQTDLTVKASLDGSPVGHLADLNLSNPAPKTQRLNATGGAVAGDGLTDIQVLELDILERAGQLSAEGFSVAVLNMAAASSPGGGVKDGAGAQEENLHRRSDAARFTMAQRGNYPIPGAACLLSQGVTVFRGTEREGYPFLGTPFKVAMISCAAPTHPRLNRSRDYANEKDRQEMKSKIGSIVRAAVEAQCDAAILSAFGCGAFGNPPEVVAEMFKTELEKAPLRQVTFCIFDDHNAGRDHNPRGNFEPFKMIFGC